MPKLPQPTPNKTLTKDDFNALYPKDDENNIFIDDDIKEIKITYDVKGVKELNPKPKYIKCACHTHLLEVTKWEDEDNMTYLTFWGYDAEVFPWSYRLKMIWNLITKGRNSIQEFVLTEKTKQDLIKYLNEN